LKVNGGLTPDCWGDWRVFAKPGLKPCPTEGAGLKVISDHSGRF
jgi:hypothetical protein